MIRQCFFPSSYRRQSRTLSRTPKQPQPPNPFPKRLDISSRRPNNSQKHRKSYNEDENILTSPDETIYLWTNLQKINKSNQLYHQHQQHQKGENQERVKKKLFLMPQRKEIFCNRESRDSRRRLPYHVSSSNSRRVGITEIKNQDWGEKGHSKRINMTERMKVNKKKQQENIIMGWDYFQESDHFF